MAILRFSEPISVPVHDLEIAKRWYCEKLDFKEMPALEDDPGAIALQHEPGEGILILGLPDEKNPGSLEPSPAVPTLFTDKIEKARNLLNSRGVACGPVQRDRQGTHYFEIRDADGNLLEISEEP